MKAVSTPLGQYDGNKIFYGIKTGFVEAFVIDRRTRDKLIAADPKSAEIIKPFVVGKDVKKISSRLSGTLPHLYETWYRYNQI